MRDLDGGADARPPRPRPGDDEEDASREPSDEGFVTEGGGTRFATAYTYLEFSDGTIEKHFAAFWDKQLSASCDVREVGPDEYACIPITIRGDEAFADPYCTEPVIALPYDLTGLRFATLGGETACAPKVARLGVFTEGPAYERAANGSCTRKSGGSTWWMTPNEGALPISTFGKFTRVKDTAASPKERSGARLALDAWRFEGEDGSFEARAPRIVDLAMSSAGTIAPATDRKLRFFPATRALEQYDYIFADSSCTTPVLWAGDDGRCHDDPFAPKAALTTALLEPRCGATGAVTLPAEGRLEVLYSSVDGTCTERGRPTPRYPVYASQTLPAIANDTLAEVTRDVVKHTRRIVSGSQIEARAVVYASADGLELHERGWQRYLPKYDIPCQLSAIGPDYTEICAPDGPWEEGPGAYFADSACTESLLALINVPTCGASAPLYRSGDKFYKYPSAAPLSVETVYYKESSGECRTHQANVPYGYTFVPRGTPEEVPLSDFPTVELRQTVTE